MMQILDAYRDATIKSKKKTRIEEKDRINFDCTGFTRVNNSSDQCRDYVRDVFRNIALILEVSADGAVQRSTRRL